MGYYMGDFYAADHMRGSMRGDPGFFSFIGKAIKGVTSLASSFLPGGGAIGAVTSHLPGAIRGPAMRIGGAILRHPVLSGAGAAGAIGLAAGMGGERMLAAPGGMPMRGFHMSKPRKGHPSHLVRNRRMRVSNPKALRRAIRRTSGFAKLAMRTIHLVHPKKRARFGGFKRRRRKAA